VGVRELHLFENCVGGSDHDRVRLRSWLSIRATLRPEVAAVAPGKMLIDAIEQISRC
jgi:hypothetical protein